MALIYHIQQLTLNVCILYDLKYEDIVAYHISEKRDFNAFATVFLKLVEKYEEKPKELFVMSDKYTAYPMALQFIQKELGITIHHTAVKGLTVNEKEDNKTRITTGYFNISGARHSLELWSFYFNFMHRSKGIFKNTLDFIDTKANFDYIRLILSS